LVRSRLDGARLVAFSSGHAFSLRVQIESLRSLALGRTAHEHARYGAVDAALGGALGGALAVDLVLPALRRSGTAHIARVL
ncbi:hypothetical protein PMAYCL1PPCAC_15212, partial [Pristionchus mayeri]